MTLTFGRFLELCAGRVVADASALPQRFLPNTDSRTIAAGETFVCLRGPAFDGHDYIAQAISRGAQAVVIDDDSKVPRTPSVPVVRVPDVKTAYLQGAGAARKLFSGRIIGVTGSNGKTTTKEFARQICAAHRRTIASPANENNELGVAKLCYRLRDDIDVAIAEMGARHPGEIAGLVEIAVPDIAILTNVSEAHLEFFHDQAELAQTKFAIFCKGAKPVCNAGDAWSRMLAAQARMEQDALWVRLVGDPTMSGIMLEAGTPRERGVAVTFGASHAFAAWQIAGEHNLRNALQAAGAAVLAGITFEQSVSVLGSLHLPPGRFERVAARSGATIVYDAYNASPTSTVAALRCFAQIPAARRIAVLGSMAELGREAGRHHEMVGAVAARCDLDELHVGGEFAAALAAGARGAGMPAEKIWTFSSNAEVAQVLAQRMGPGDSVLLKGSRVAKMEEILRAITGNKALAS